jgi:hypothetical protein
MEASIKYRDYNGVRCQVCGHPWESYTDEDGTEHPGHTKSSCSPALGPHEINSAVEFFGLGLTHAVMGMSDKVPSGPRLDTIAFTMGYQTVITWSVRHQSSIEAATAAFRAGLLAGLLEEPRSRGPCSPTEAMADRMGHALADIARKRL